MGGDGGGEGGKVDNTKAVLAASSLSLQRDFGLLSNWQLEGTAKGPGGRFV